MMPTVHMKPTNTPNSLWMSHWVRSRRRAASPGSRRITGQASSVINSPPMLNRLKATPVISRRQM